MSRCGRKEKQQDLGPDGKWPKAIREEDRHRFPGRRKMHWNDEQGGEEEWKERVNHDTGRYMVMRARTMATMRRTLA